MVRMVLQVVPLPRLAPPETFVTEVGRNLSLGRVCVNRPAERGVVLSRPSPRPSPWEGELHLDDWADFHCSYEGDWALCRVGDRFVQVLGFDHVEADQLVAGLDERA